MTWPQENVISSTATLGACTDGPPRREVRSRLDRFEPADPTEHGQSSDGALATIQSRANRLRFNNAVQRQRFLDLHRTLSKAL